MERRNLNGIIKAWQGEDGAKKPRTKIIKNIPEHFSAFLKLFILQLYIMTRNKYKNTFDVIDFYSSLFNVIIAD